MRLRHLSFHSDVGMAARRPLHRVEHIEPAVDDVIQDVVDGPARMEERLDVGRRRADGGGEPPVIRHEQVTEYIRRRDRLRLRAPVVAAALVDVNVRVNGVEKRLRVLDRISDHELVELGHEIRLRQAQHREYRQPAERGYPDSRAVAAEQDGPVRRFARPPEMRNQRTRRFFRQPILVKLVLELAQDRASGCRPGVRTVVPHAPPRTRASAAASSGRAGAG